MRKGCVARSNLYDAKRYKNKNHRMDQWFGGPASVTARKPLIKLLIDGIALLLYVDLHEQTLSCVIRSGKGNECASMK